MYHDQKIPERKNQKVASVLQLKCKFLLVLLHIYVLTETLGIYESTFFLLSYPWELLYFFF